MRYLLLLVGLLLTTSSFGQIYDPVSWATSVEKTNDSTYTLIATATIEEGWHLYSQEVPDGGPIATEFNFQKNAAYDIVGETTEGEGMTIQDPVFDMEITYFEDEVDFRQEISYAGAPIKVMADVTFMVCDDARCLPPGTEELMFAFPGYIEKGTSIDIAASQKDSTPSKTAPAAKKQELEVDNATDSQQDQGLLRIFIIAFLSGFAALLTPCVFPMIPMTVSFFTKQSKTRAKGISNAIVYGLSIIVIYVLLGSLVTLVFGADSLNALSTNVWFNLIFFVILVLFAVSFMGAFEIVLPSSWSTKIDSHADRSGFVGIFFMALALAIVSFSCTGPIVGTLLVEAASNGGIAPVIGMLGFSMAIAIPFALFAAFPGWMNTLPKSGGWLNTVKVVLGFLELAFAFKFLSNADLVMQYHLLERETFLAIWIAIFGVLAFYLFGKITLPHDSPLPHISVGRLSLGMIVLTFTIYMIPGLWGAPLQWISGFPPPLQYSESPYGVGDSRGGATNNTALPEHAELGPHDIPVFKDYNKGMAYAKKVNKPVMLDFTGYACVNCRKMEERVWPDPQVLEILKDKIVLVSLYVDDKRDLPQEEMYTAASGKKITTVGGKWSDFQIEKYKANAQPYYVLIDHDGNNLNAPAAYNPDAEEYLAWLREGIENF
ncbi:MAG TPA: thioredoxin family protein [Leeuwenhoekiella sp.]|nr:thioredoxin family protein [Leeuwenhoekiella sp.]